MVGQIIPPQKVELFDINNKPAPDSHQVDALNAKLLPMFLAFALS
jgi:hypothetical protein